MTLNFLLSLKTSSKCFGNYIRHENYLLNPCMFLFNHKKSSKAVTRITTLEIRVTIYVVIDFKILIILIILIFSNYIFISNFFFICYFGSDCINFGSSNNLDVECAVIYCFIEYLCSLISISVSQKSRNNFYWFSILFSFELIVLVYITHNGCRKTKG